MITYICYIDGSYISNIQNKIGHACVIIKNNYIVDVIVDNFVARVKLNSALAELMGLLFSLKHIQCNCFLLLHTHVQFYFVC